MRSTWLTFVVMCLLAAAAPARAQKEDAMNPEAKAHYDRGIAHYAAKDFDAASTELAQAYFIDPKREIVFAWGQAKRLAGDCASAIPLYRKYLDSDPPASTAEKVKQHLATCQAQVPIGTESDPTTPPVVAPQVPESAVTPVVAEPAPVVVVTRRRPFYKDPLGDVLVGLGAAGVGVGATFFVMSKSSGKQAEDATSYADFQRAASDGAKQRKIAIISLAAGGAVLVGGVLRWATQGGREQRVPDMAVVPAAGGASLVMGWRFR